jgi:hypothetical protein
MAYRGRAVFLSLSGRSEHAEFMSTRPKRLLRPVTRSRCEADRRLRHSRRGGRGGGWEGSGGSGLTHRRFHPHILIELAVALWREAIHMASLPTPDLQSIARPLARLARQPALILPDS